MQAEYQKALEIVTQHPVLTADLDREVLQDLSVEFQTGGYFLGLPAPEDEQAFVCAIVALKMLAGCECDFDRAASARLLRAAADQIGLYQFADDPEYEPPLDRITVANATEEIKVLLICYPPSGYAVPARSRVLGSIRWNHLT